MTTSFGTRLRAARLAAGMTQIQLARGIVTTSQLSLLESDKRRPSPTTLEALAKRLQIRPGELVIGTASIGRERLESRLDQARRALAQRNFATAERLATQVLQRPTHAERRIEAHRVRAEAREGQRRFRAALDDLQQAHALARRRPDSAMTVSIAIACARLRSQLQADDAA